MTRLAVLSDIHGNLPALEAVLDDMQAQENIDACWVLGDLIAYFPWSAEVIARLRTLHLQTGSQLSCLQGNFDRYVTTGYRPPVPVRAPEDWARMPALLKLREARFRWAVARLSYEDYRFLRDLPTHLEMEVPGYGRVRAVHATPSDDETFLLPTMSDKEIRPHLANLNARHCDDCKMLLCGHTHLPMDRTVDTTRLVNPGSVGLPLDGDPQAAYALLDFVDDICAVTLRRVAYDVEAMIREMEKVAYPAWEHLGHIARLGKRTHRF